MGLAITVGFLADQLQHDEEGAQWFRDSVAGLNKVLEANDLAPHVEPETLPEIRRDGIGGFPYSFLHYLRRAYAYQMEGRPVPDGDLTNEHDSVISDASLMFDSHLLCHSDCEGFYVPQEFTDPIFDDNVPGSMLGSSQAMLRELQRIAAVVGVDLDGGAPTPAAIEAINNIVDEGAHYREKIVWLTLWAACSASIEHNTLVVFC